MPDEIIGTEEPKDLDTWDSFVEGIPYALYIYYLDDSRFRPENIAILGHSNAIQSIQYTPFLDPGFMNLYRIPYDTERFGSISKLRPSLKYTPDVFRVVKVAEPVRILGQFTTYKVENLSIKGKRDWRNESKLYNYPYSFAILTDNINTPMTIKYHLCPRYEHQTVKVRQTISDRCSYGIFIDGYKGDKKGSMEAMVSGDALTLPCSSSAYSQWFASSKNQAQFGVQQSLKESFLQQSQTNQSLGLQAQSAMVNGMIGGIGSLMVGSLGGMLSTMGGLFNTTNSLQLQGSQAQATGTLQRQGITGALMAQERDLESTPNTLTSMGSDCIYGISKGEKKLQLIRYTITEEYAKRIGDYFHMYGYKQNRLMPIKLRSRHYFNFMKTVGANIHAPGVPREHLEKIKSILDRGITLWHVDREGVKIGDYSMDNYEQSLDNK